VDVDNLKVKLQVRSYTFTWAKKVSSLLAHWMTNNYILLKTIFQLTHLVNVYRIENHLKGFLKSIVDLNNLHLNYCHCLYCHAIKSKALILYLYNMSHSAWFCASNKLLIQGTNLSIIITCSFNTEWEVPQFDSSLRGNAFDLFSLHGPWTWFKSC